MRFLRIFALLIILTNLIYVPTHVFSQSQRYVIFVWHMHQPLYYLPGDNEFRAPWVRLWLMKGYYPMLAYVNEITNISVVFDYTPTLLNQLLKFRDGWNDTYYDLSWKPSNQLNNSEKTFILSRFFDVNWDVQVSKFPRYKYLLDKRNQLLEEYGSVDSVIGFFNESDYLDLQVLFNLVWINEYIIEENTTLKQIFEKAINSTNTTHFTEEEKIAILQAYRVYINKFFILLEKLLRENRIELIMTPYYYPISPLVINTSSAVESDPGIPLPVKPFQHPEDLNDQVELSVNYMKTLFDKSIEGLWLPEMAVSDKTIEILAKHNISHTFLDESILSRILEREPEYHELYLPWVKTYSINGNNYAITLFFRDQELSDMIWGSAWYSQTYGEETAAQALYDRIQRRFEYVEAYDPGKPHIIVIALDGENPWDKFPHDGMIFVRRLYQLLINNGIIVTTVTDPDIREIISQYAFTPDKPIPVGSWINGRLDTWIGEWEENLAWRILYEARRDAELHNCSLDVIREYLYPAEMGDLFWWYGRDQEAITEGVFDEIFRGYITSFYKACNITYNYTWPLDTPIHYRSDADINTVYVNVLNASITPLEQPVEIKAYVKASTLNTRAVIVYSSVINDEWSDEYYTLMNRQGVEYIYQVYSYNLPVTQDKYEVYLIIQGSNDYHVKQSQDENIAINLVEFTNTSINNVYIEKIEHYNYNGVLKQTYTQPLPSVIHSVFGDYFKIYVRLTPQTSNVHVFTRLSYMLTSNTSVQQYDVEANYDNDTGLFIAVYKPIHTGIWSEKLRVVGNTLLTFDLPVIEVISTGIRSIDGDPSDWNGIPPLDNNTWTISNDEWIWRDAIGDERTDFSNPDLRVDLVEFRITSDNQYLYIMLLFNNMSSFNIGDDGATVVMITIDRDLVTGSGEIGLYGFPETSIDNKATWEYLIIINLADSRYRGKGLRSIIHALNTSSNNWGAVFQLVDQNWSHICVQNDIGDYGLLGVDLDNNCIEARISWDLIGGPPVGEKIRVTAATGRGWSNYANNEGGLWEAYGSDVLDVMTNITGNTWYEVSDGVINYYAEIQFTNTTSPVPVPETNQVLLLVVIIPLIVLLYKLVINKRNTK